MLASGSNAVGKSITEDIRVHLLRGLYIRTGDGRFVSVRDSAGVYTQRHRAYAFYAFDVLGTKS